MASIHVGPALPQPRKHWPWYLFGTILFITVLPLLPHPYSDPELLVGTVGGLWAFAFYMQSRHAEDARFLKELLGAFNEKYDGMNNGLRASLRRDGRFTESDCDLWVDYFNLCAEEWLFYEMGYIPGPVWNAWENGMKQYGEDSRVKELWLKECETNSYYDFKFPWS